jgi:hypothetical protein
MFPVQCIFYNILPQKVKLISNGHYFSYINREHSHVYKHVDTYVALCNDVALTLPEHLSSPPLFNGVRVARSLVFCEVFSRLVEFSLC